MSDEVLGTSIVLKVNTGTVASPSWTAIGSQKDAEWSPTSAIIDVSSKESGFDSDFKSARRSETIRCDAMYIQSHAAYSKLLAAYRADNDDSRKIQIMKTENTTDYEWAYGYITSMPHRFPDQAPAEISIEIQITGKWTAV